MALKVKEVIEYLQKQDPEAPVYVHCFEDFNGAHSIRTREDMEANPDDNELYCKGISYSEYNRSISHTLNYVVIADERT